MENGTVVTCSICGKPAVSDHIPLCKAHYQIHRKFCKKHINIGYEDFACFMRMLHNAIGDLKLYDFNLVKFYNKVKDDPIRMSTLPEIIKTFLYNLSNNSEKPTRHYAKHAKSPRVVVSEQYRYIPLKRRPEPKIKEVEEGFPGGVKFMIEANEKGGIIRSSTFTFTANGSVNDALTDFAKLRDMIRI